VIADDQSALIPVLVASIVVPLVVLGIVMRIMWRSSKRHGSDGGTRSG
jgi:hypothetical protein